MGIATSMNPMGILPTASKPFQLPSGYTPCEYIESTGKQFLVIDPIGITSTSTEPYIVDIYADVQQMWEPEEGDYVQVVWQNYLEYNGSSKMYFRRIGAKNLCNTNTANNFERAELHHHFDSSLGTYDQSRVYRNGVQNGACVYAKFRGSNTCSYFANVGRELVGKTSITITNNHQSAYIRLYEAKRYYNGELNYWLVPALNRHGKPCMYDVVRRKAYHNLGTEEDFLYALKGE